MASSKESKHSKKTHKVIKLTDQSTNPKPDKEKPKGMGMAMPSGIQSLKLVGSIKEKGFSDDQSGANYSLPEPRATAFPKARHRSEGPYWSPLKPEPVGIAEDTKDAEDVGAEYLADYACPLERRKKKGIDFSDWKGKLKMEEPPGKMDKPSMNEGKEKRSSNLHKEMKYVKASSVELCSEFSESKFSAPERKAGESPEGLEGEPGACVPISEVDNASEGKTKIPVPRQSYDTVVSHLNSLQVSARSDKTKEIIKGDAARAHGHRTEREDLKSGIDIEEIDVENWATLQAMPTNEIEEAKTELLGKMRPEIVEMLKRRGAEKLKRASEGTAKLNKSEKIQVEDGKTNLNGNCDEDVTSKSHIQENLSTTRGDESNESGKTFSTDLASNQWSTWSHRVEAVRNLRFSLDGSIVELEEAALDTTSLSQNGDNSDISHLDVHNVAERDFLRTEGDPASAGYTIKEAVTLVRSVVPGQRAIALHLLAIVLGRAVFCLNQNEVQYDASLDINCRNNSVDWQAVWAYALGPEPELVLTLRMALDDSHSTVVVACAKVLQQLLSCSANESYFNLSETSWAGEKSMFIAPIFRKQSKLEDGFLGGGFWKYNAKPSNMFPFLNQNAKEDGEGEATVGDDTTVAGQDVAAGLIRMSILPRIRYILEVDQLAAAEEPFLSVITSLARHSPTAADAVMKCPRLMDTVIQRYIIRQTDIKVDPLQVKAVHLLKVLCEANRENCIHFLASGVFPSASRHLFSPYNLGDWLSMDEESFRSICAMLVEELRLWKVCIEYGLCVSCFGDFYPALCLWLSPPSYRILIEKNKLGEVLSLSRESFIVLEALARMLPNLHSDAYEEDKETDGTSFENWSWSQVVPLVDVALQWLDVTENTFLLTTYEPDKYVPGPIEHGSYRIKLLEVISAVLLMLACIIKKIIPEKDIGYHSSDKEQPSGKWLPLFFPQVALQIIKSRLLHFSETDLEEVVQCNTENSSFLKFLCRLRKETDHHTSLLAASCIHGLIQLITAVDKAINTQVEKTGIACMNEDISECDKILRLGLIVSCQDELKYTLDMFMDFVVSEWDHVQCCEVNGRGGPAPGVGIGWGGPNEGFWSKKMLLAQADARVSMSLLNLFPIVLKKDVSDFVKLNLQNNVTDSFFSDTVEKINAALSIILISGPGDMHHIEKTLSFLVSVPVMEFLSVFVYEISSAKEMKTQFISMFCQADFEIFSKVLLVHLKNKWLMKKSKIPKSGETKMEPDNGTGSRIGHARSSLASICEGSAELAYEKPMTLAIEWSHQRLPVPVQWLLSPLSTSIVQTDDVLDDGLVRKDSIFNNVRSGLFFLLGLEAMFLCNGIRYSSVSCIPLVRKIHALSMVFILEGDMFLEPPVRDLLGTLQGLYGEALDRNGAISMPEVQGSRNGSLLTSEACNVPLVDQKVSRKFKDVGTLSLLDFQRDIDERYETFVESFVEHFGATSFGDIVYGRQVAIYLRRDVAATIRVTAWNALASAHILELLPTLDECCGHAEGYLFPPEDHDKMIEAYVYAWVSGNLDKAADRMAVTFSLALHHIVFFLFLGNNGSEKLQLRKQLVRRLILDSSRKPCHQARMVSLLQYNALLRIEANGDFSNGPAVTMDEIARRFNFLSEACEGDSLLLAEVQKLQATALGK